MQQFGVSPNIDALADRAQEITFGDALKYARHIAAGIDHLHRHKLLHLDLKPGNVLVRE